MQLVKNKLNMVMKLLKKQNKKVLIGLCIAAVVGVGVWVFFLRNRNQESFSNGNTFNMYGVDWCGHCQKTKPEVQKLKDSPPDNCSVNIVNCEEQEELCASKNIKGYPTCELTKSDGANVPYTGERTEPAFRAFILKHA